MSPAAEKTYLLFPSLCCTKSTFLEIDYRWHELGPCKHVMRMLKTTIDDLQLNMSLYQIPFAFLLSQYMLETSIEIQLENARQKRLFPH